GGPTEPSVRGDHYDMTARRRAFEHLHKSAGYLALALGVAAIVTGLWQANAPRWMWIALAAWWGLFLAAFVALQRRGLAFDTYQAIWGPDACHPGNARRPIGWGVRRPPAVPGE
ncbi:MAG: cytochrome b561 domain-containing protein, partial [Beijerinckiaceae bacterium]